MYCEISPRQSGKTTRLIQAALEYLSYNPTHNIAVVGINSNAVNDLKRKFLREGASGIGNVANRINFMSGYLFSSYRGTEPDYWFFDEFGYLLPRDILHTIYSNVIENAYYCTTPGSSNATDIIVNYCTRNNIQIHFNNPWTESHIQNLIGWDNYLREAVLGDWVRYMETKGLFDGIKINLIRKEIKKHRFTSW